MTNVIVILGGIILEVTIKDVAKYAGVSVATISRVLNKSAVVSPETSEKVLHAIKELNYKPNFLGRNLRKRETNVILALVPSTEHTYYSEIIHGMQVKAADCGYDILTSVTNSYRPLEEKLLGMLFSRTVDAAVLLGSTLSSERLNELSQTNTIALCCEGIKGADVLSVTIDNEKAAFDAVDYLISIGHSCIGMVSTEVRAPSSVERERGYRKALEKAGMEVCEEYIYRGGYDYGSGMKAVEKFMSFDKKPTAIFAISDFLAAGVIKKSIELGIRPGREFSVIGFDNVSMAQIYTPSITTVEQPCFKMGVTVAELLIPNIGNNQNKSIITMPHRLILRETTGD